MNYHEILRHITSWKKTTFLIRNNACIVFRCASHRRKRYSLQMTMPRKILAKKIKQVWETRMLWLPAAATHPPLPCLPRDLAGKTIRLVKVKVEGREGDIFPASCDKWLGGISVAKVTTEKGSTG